MAARKGSANETYHWSRTGNASNKSIIQVTDHDVLSGRGVNIAQHAGNERFRALVNSRHDTNYCTSYTTAEKRAVAEDIVAHIKSLNPPGRFLRRNGRSNRSVRGLDGPWEELSREEEIKKTCQALRDCNRQDRSGYAAAVPVPEDVHYSESLRVQSGLTNKQLAQVAAAQAKLQADQANIDLMAKRSREDLGDSNSSARSSPHEDPLAAPSPHNASSGDQAHWLVKKPRLEAATTPRSHATPATAASSGGFNSVQASSGHSHHDLHQMHPQPSCVEPFPLSLSDDHLQQQFIMGYSPAATAAASLSHLDPRNTIGNGHHANHPTLRFHDDSQSMPVHFRSDVEDDEEDCKPTALTLSQQGEHLDGDYRNFHHVSGNHSLVPDPLHLSAETEAAGSLQDEHDHLPLLSATVGSDPEDYGRASPSYEDNLY
jgi:hypothetical protein